VIQEIKDITRKLAFALKIVGLINIQFAIKDEKIYIIEANPRASRTIPFISKFKNIPFASIATKLICGMKLSSFILPDEDKDFGRYAVKIPVFPFLKFKDADCILGPEMKSTGESMGIDKSFEGAFAKAFISAYGSLPLKGNVLISVNNSDKNEKLIEICNLLVKNNFNICATSGTFDFLKENGIESKKISKIHEGRPDIMDLIINNEISIFINTSDISKSFLEGVKIRRAAMIQKIPCIRNLLGALALAKSIDYAKNNTIEIYALQDFK
jgi:carbamoyl-phosphate synthase large subunit